MSEQSFPNDLLVYDETAFTVMIKELSVIFIDKLNLMNLCHDFESQK